MENETRKYKLYFLYLIIKFIQEILKRKTVRNSFICVNSSYLKEIHPQLYSQTLCYIITNKIFCDFIILHSLPNFPHRKKKILFYIQWHNSMILFYLIVLVYFLCSLTVALLCRQVHTKFIDRAFLVISSLYLVETRCMHKQSFIVSIDCEINSINICCYT